MRQRTAMGCGLGRFLECVKRTGADVAVDDAERAYRRGDRERIGLDRGGVRGGHGLLPKQIAPAGGIARQAYGSERVCDVGSQIAMTQIEMTLVTLRHN